jgi:type IV secretory pathway VirD2 relaxase
MADDDFDIWLGRVAADRSTAGRMRRAVNLAGGRARSSAGGRRFTGARIGRGGAVGRLLSTSDRFTGARARRVVVKTRYVKMAGKGAGRAAAHMCYLQRDGTTRDGERGGLYGADQDVADGKAFQERCSGDRHQFRFIVAAEDGAEYDDLKPLVRRLMVQAEKDLGTKLDWMAVDHFNTGHPHSHILLRGKDADGADLVIGREYLTQGLRMRATELVNLDLGPRTDIEIARAQAREITAERFTGIDRRLVQAIDGEGLVSLAHPNGIEQAARAGRLQALARMGLATEEPRGHWRLDAELEPTLRAMGRRGDIIATLDAALARSARGDITPWDYAIYEPHHAATATLVGRVITTGLSDEQADRRYSILEATDGRAWHVDLGEVQEAPAIGSIVKVQPSPVIIRKADVTVAEIAAANGGRYSEDVHLRHDPAAREEYATAHVRRLEALRRAGAEVTRLPDGTWEIASDHVERVRAHEQRRAERQPVVIDTLATQSLDRLTRHDGVTWLDRELAADRPTHLERGFGEEVRQAQALRRQWLVEQELMAADGVQAPDMIARLQQRELMRVGRQLAKEMNLDFAEARDREHIEGQLRRIVPVGDGKFALVERSRDFVLVPWRPSLEKQIGKQVSGIMRLDGSTSWEIGRNRGLGIG